MSAHEALPIKLSPKARQDFIDILRFTGETWGLKQLEAYRDKIDDALQTINRNPQVGHCRGDLPPTHLVYLVGSHVIVYRPGRDSIGVSRILHQRMSLGRHL